MAIVKLIYGMDQYTHLRRIEYREYGRRMIHGMEVALVRRTEEGDRYSRVYTTGLGLKQPWLGLEVTAGLSVTPAYKTRREAEAALAKLAETPWDQLRPKVVTLAEAIEWTRKAEARLKRRCRVHIQIEEIDHG